MTNNKQLSLNILISILNQLVIIVCGFILPRVLLESFGSTVNGLVTSIRQFLNFITFLEMGIGVVISSSLYEPLFKQDTEKVSAIIVSSKRFFNKLVLYFTFFLVVLVFTYPLFVVEFNFVYVSILMVILSLNLYSQYYFGIVNQLLLTADQKNYIPQGLSMVTVILNTLATAVIVNYSKNVHIVFLSTSFIYLARPLAMDIYVRKCYNIDYNIRYTEEPIKQKFNGFYHHLSSIVLGNTDIIVLTLLSSLKNISIYSVYALIFSGIRGIIYALVTSLTPYFGRVVSKESTQGVLKKFRYLEWGLNTLITLIFSVVAASIIPFITLYTQNITDADYILYGFALFMCLSQYMFCMRYSYNIYVQSVGHYKETQMSAIIEAILNIASTFIFTALFGMVGLAIGTLIAMLYRLLYLLNYSKKVQLGASIIGSILYIFTGSCNVVAMFYLGSYLAPKITTFMHLVYYTMGYVLLSVLSLLLSNLIFNRRLLLGFFKSLILKDEL
ncbi:lipopolysaccharide biosynthesis protein [Streptococcus suis]|uniref:lipopolysaccharide biosynthesis protein n=1 Tax=Streptococcus suis TaxID=1307 RepID=UPI000CF592BD|nr:sugar isomerase [Streptococcus suis]MBY4954716.1 hypothetical protein [Streptococcus suis]MBY5015842.1 hypothetical protein [Streptococcus suis]